MNNRPIAIAYLLLAATTATAGIVEHHLYTPTSLPSAQGWLYQSNGFAEEDVFAIEDGLLVMDTMGDGMDGEIFVHYLRDVAHAEVQSAVMRIRARLTAYEQDPEEFYRGFAFGGYAPGWGPWFQFGLEPGALHVNANHLQDLDTGVWHEYTVVTEGFYPDHECVLYVDGAVVATFTGESTGTINSAFTVGDPGRHANARVEIAEIELTTFHGDPVAVEQRSLSSLKSLFTD